MIFLKADLESWNHRDFKYTYIYIYIYITFVVNILSGHPQEVTMCIISYFKKNQILTTFCKLEMHFSNWCTKTRLYQAVSSNRCNKRGGGLTNLIEDKGCLHLQEMNFALPFEQTGKICLFIYFLSLVDERAKSRWRDRFCPSPFEMSALNEEIKNSLLFKLMLL